MTTEQVINLVDKIIWPLLILVIYLINSKKINRLINPLINRVEKGAEFQVSTFRGHRRIKENQHTAVGSFVGWTINKFPAFANTRPLARIVIVNFKK